MRRFLSTTILLAFILATVCVAQNNSAKFESHTRLVLVPVRVTDSKGAPIPNLTEKDFTIISDGKPQPISSFEGFIDVNAPPAESAEPENPLEFNNVTYHPPRHLTVIAFDPQNTPPDQRVQAVRAVQKFLSSPNAPNEPIALVVFHGSGIQILHEFTTDRDALKGALKVASFWNDSVFSSTVDTTGNIAVGPGGAAETGLRRAQTLTTGMQQQMQNITNDEASDTQAAALGSLATMLEPSPGQKTLIWITQGFRLRMTAPTMGTLTTDANSGRGTRIDLWDETFRTLNSGNISVFPVDARGLTTLQDMSDRSDMDSLVSAHPDLGGARDKAKSSTNNELLAAVGWIADQTGGRPYFNTNNISGAVVDAITLSTSSYMMSFHVPSGVKKGWHSVQVKTSVPDSHVQAKSGFDIVEPKKGKEDKELQDALLSPFAMGALPLMVRWTSAVESPKNKAKRIVEFQLAVVPGALDVSGVADPRLSLEIRSVARNMAEKVVTGYEKKVDMALDAANAQKLAASGFSLKGALEVEPGDYNVTFGVQDLVTGRVGTVKAVLKLQP